jgi:hypothetical protein
MKQPKFFLKAYLPWKSFVLGVFLGGMRLQSLSGLLMIIFWVVCGYIVGRYLHVHWRIMGYFIGFPVGFITSSIFTWAIFGKGRKNGKIQ